ncbi:Oidioi.mRNA.OKI2018_I69.chr1.g2022.t1.cds [Oikopleura dioica]|uniref:Oidioi.mRNA.OKI2018_I69.chr1.g2022.t1.cds n=1 Tax=Oikopleura dioica TaxID=34765 RepID=A0ABN7SV39_OIKDI|nr:Oidioi.mRNA.OKI2018_I69.chr1.g2022.t1.cds [Oikopleura dioica]
MSVVIPEIVIRDLSKYEESEFEGSPRWSIIRNNAGLQLQMFWQAKSDDEEIKEENGNVVDYPIPRKNKRKRNPIKIEKTSEDERADGSARTSLEDSETSSEMVEVDTALRPEHLSQLHAYLANSISNSLSSSTSSSSSLPALPSTRGLEGLINLRGVSLPDDTAVNANPPRPNKRRSPAPRFYPLTDPVVKFLQETLVEDTQGRVACSDLSDLSAQKFGNAINMVSMGMKLRFLYPNVTRVKINNRAFYTNVKVRAGVS